MAGRYKVLPSDKANLKQWQAYFDRLPLKNVYSLPKYIKFLEWHYGDEAMLFLYEDDDAFVYFPYFRKNLANPELRLDPNGAVDGRYHYYASWYYGGPLSNPEKPDSRFRQGFSRAWSQHALDSGAVSDFVGFDANINNHLLFPESESAFDRETVFVALTPGKDEIWSGFNQSNRWAVNRARRDGVEINVAGPDDDRSWRAFADIYHAEMVRKSAPPHLFFDHAFFDRLRGDLPDNVRLVVSSLNGEICGGVMLIFGDIHCFGFLSATVPKYWQSQVNNLGWAESIWWAKSRGYKVFDLMGGRPGVFKFKSHFSRTRSRFFVRKAIHDSDTFDRLVAVRNKTSGDTEGTAVRRFPEYL